MRHISQANVGPEGPTPLKKSVGAGGEEFEEVEVAEDLELLADLSGRCLPHLLRRGLAMWIVV